MGKSGFELFEHPSMLFPYTKYVLTTIPSHIYTTA